MLLTEALLKENLITPEQLKDAKAKQIGAKKPIHAVLIDMGFVKEEDLFALAKRIFNIPVIDLNQEKVSPEALRRLPYVLAKRYGVFPIRIEDNALVLAVSDPHDIIAQDNIRSVTQLKVKPVLCAKSMIERQINQSYHSNDQIYALLKNTTEESKIELIGKESFDANKPFVAEVTESGVPIVQMCNMLITDAVRARASDIHIDPQEDCVKVRYRIDGDLRNIIEIPGDLKNYLAARIKVISGLDIAETRKPQDGRSKILVNGKRIDMRVSVIPTFHGEKVEIRLLDPEEAKVDLQKLGLGETNLVTFKEAIVKTQGLILVTGPTGSGKTSTLYAILHFIKSEKKNIVTIEDPIEYLVEGVSQTQVNPAKEVTFATALRTFLRQDPNVILVGEIRDRETADIAFRSSLTGHLVLSTLHTNHAVSSITRLLDIGLESYLIASSLILVVAQRLVKVICPHCKEEYVPDKNLQKDFGRHIETMNIKKFYHGKGCNLCGFTGYFGRTAIFEMLKMDESTRRLIAEKAPEGQILQDAQNKGLKPLVIAGMEKVAEGITTLDEILRVVGSKEEDKTIQQILKAGKNIRILIADDEEHLLISLEKRLLSAGYEVIKARDGSEAVKLAYKEKPDLIITDVTMPRMHGFEVVKTLRASLETAAIPIIMLTARADKESELKGLDAGADDYLVKPFDSEKLLARLKMLLRRTKSD